MRKISKISLVAAVAVAGFSTANAQPLEEAIKNVDVSGSVVYRYDNFHNKDVGTTPATARRGNGDSGTNNYKVGLNLSSKVNDYVKFNSRFLVADDNNGGFVAGLNAGLVHNHWPLMSDGQFIHDSVFIEQKTLFLNLVEGKSGVQFVHRTMAYIVVALIVALYLRSKKYLLTSLQKKSIIGLVFIILVIQDIMKPMIYSSVVETHINIKPKKS